MCLLEPVRPRSWEAACLSPGRFHAPELPAAKLTIRREPEGVKIFEGRARLLVGLEPSVASNLCVLCHFQGVIHFNSKVPHGALDPMS
jgi:hypothetical protein